MMDNVASPQCNYNVFSSVQSYIYYFILQNFR